jgi:hypothetical protein
VSGFRDGAAQLESGKGNECKTLVAGNQQGTCGECMRVHRYGIERTGRLRRRDTGVEWLGPASPLNRLIKPTFRTWMAYGHFNHEIPPAQLIRQIQSSPPQHIPQISWVKCPYDPNLGLVGKVA